MSNAETKAYTKMGDQRYRRVGKKYVPCNDPWATDGLHDGWWLVRVAPGCKTIRQILHPAKAELIAAAKDKEDQLIEIIRKASELRPANNSLSPEAQKDWDEFMKKHGKELSTLYYPSFTENAERIIEALVENKQ